MIKSKRNYKTVFLIIIWVILAFLLESSDLFISINLYDPAYNWVIFFEKFGEIPGILVVLAGLYIYIVTFKASSNLKKILITSFLLTACSLMFVFVLLLLSKGITGSSSFFKSNLFFLFLIAVLINILIVYLLKKKSTFSARAILFSRVTFYTFFIGYILIIQPLKLFWGRVRFRDLAENYSNFSAWYLPQGITGNDSFPSGHATMGWMLITLFVFFTAKSLAKRIALKGLIIIWALSVCISRVVIGAHYTSDVVFASFIIIITYRIVLNYTAQKNILDKI